MKKQILELLKELGEFCVIEPCLHIKSNFKGYITIFKDKKVDYIIFSSETDLIKELKDKIKELNK